MIIYYYVPTILRSGMEQYYATGLLLAWVVTIGIAIFYYIKQQENFDNQIDRIEKSYLERFDLWKQTELQSIIKSERQDAVDRSRHVIKGKISEHLAPYFPEFIEHYNPSEARFIGAPIDYIVFKNLSLVESSDIPVEIVILDIKTGTSSLNKRQRRIRDAIKNGRISFDVIRVET